MDNLLYVLVSLSIVISLITMYLVLKSNKNEEQEDVGATVKDYIKDENFKLSEKLTDEFGELRVKLADFINKWCKRKLIFAASMRLLYWISILAQINIPNY